MNKKQNKLLTFIKCSPKSGTHLNSLEILSHLVVFRLNGRGIVVSSLTYSYADINIIMCSFPPHFPFYLFTILHMKIGLGLSSREVHALQTHLCLINFTPGTCRPTTAYWPAWVPILPGKSCNYCKNVLIPPSEVHASASCCSAGQSAEMEKTQPDLMGTV